MKTFSAAITTQYASGAPSFATALKITRPDNEVYAFTSNDVIDTVAGITYSASPGLQVTNIEIIANLAVGNLEIVTLHDGSLFTIADILGGVWRNSAFHLFRYNSAGLTDGIDTLLVGTIGEVGIRQNDVVAELRDLRQYMQQDIGPVSGMACRARLGDSKCTKVLTSFTYSGTLTHVTSNQVFRDSTRAEALAWFDEGEITFTSGPNTGLRAKIKAHTADGTFTLALPLWGTVAVGNAYTAIAGCRKRLAEDCVAKFNNVLNYQGEPHRKGINNLTSSPLPDV